MAEIACFESTASFFNKPLGYVRGECTGISATDVQVSALPYKDARRFRNRRQPITIAVTLNSVPSPQSSTIAAVRSPGRALSAGKSSVCSAWYSHR